jgi:hypothetical protein
VAVAVATPPEIVVLVGWGVAVALDVGDGVREGGWVVVGNEDVAVRFGACGGGGAVGAPGTGWAGTSTGLPGAAGSAVGAGATSGPPSDGPRGAGVPGLFVGVCTLLAGCRAADKMGVAPSLVGSAVIAGRTAATAPKKSMNGRLADIGVAAMA